MTRIGEPRRGRYSGWPHLTVVTLIVAGALGLQYRHEDPPPAHDCTPVTLQDGDHSTARTLTDAGWVLVGTHLYPPGCEADR